MDTMALIIPFYKITGSRDAAELTTQVCLCKTCQCPTFGSWHSIRNCTPAFLFYCCT